MSDPVEVRVSCGSRQEADRIAAALLGRRLAASVQQIAVRSRYRWRGEIAEADEVVLAARTVRGRYSEIEAVVRELHSYEIPSITCVDLVAGNADYLAWLEAETS